MHTPRLRLHYLQHVPFEGPGSIAAWARAKGHAISSTCLFRDDPFPALDKIDWLIIMGGPMGVYDEGAYPWLRQEKEFIRQAIAGGKTVIGICLGAQLIAHVLGARVYPNPGKEIGWFPVSIAPETRPGPVAEGSPELMVFHWHGDTFDLPENAVRIASSAACRNQGFLYNERVLGLQFHPEATASSVAEMVKAGAEELSTVETDPRKTGMKEKGNCFVQAPAEILGRNDLVPAANRFLEHLLDRLAP